MSRDVFVFLREVPSFAEVSRVLAPVGCLQGEGREPWYLVFDADPSIHFYLWPGGDEFIEWLYASERVALDGFGRGTASITITYQRPDDPIVDEMVRLMAAAWPVVVNDEVGHLVLGEDFSSVAAMQDLPCYVSEEDLESDR